MLRPQALSLLLAPLVACSPSREEKPPIQDCVGDCVITTPGGGGGTSGAAGAGGAAGTGGGGGAAGAVAGVQVQGTVVIHTDITFQNPPPYSFSALLSASPADVTQPPADNWTGTGFFSLSQVASGKSWIKATPTALADTTLGGILLVDLDPAQPSTVDVPVVDTALISTLLGTLPGSPALNQNAAHALLTFVSGAGTPEVGLKVEPSFGALRAYDNGPQFADTETGNRGQALLLNAAPVAGPTVTFTTQNGFTGMVPLLLEASTMTFVTVVLP